MSTRFIYQSIYETYSWAVLYDAATGYQDKYLQLCEEKVKSTEFPNLDITIEEFVTGGVFFNKEKTKMLGVSFRRTEFKELGIYFRAQQFGNMVYYSLLMTVDRGLFDVMSGNSTRDKLGTIRAKCKNLAQWEEFSSLSCLGRLVFRAVLGNLDPNFKENESLFTLKPKE